MDSLYHSKLLNATELDPKRPEDFAELVKLHHANLLVYARALTQDSIAARDIVQESFIVAFEKAEVFDITRDFATWMRGIVRNKWREWLRKNHRYDLSEPELARLDADIESWQAREAEGKSSLLESLELCVKRLPDNLQETIHAFYFEGRSGEETAELLGLAPAAVRKRLQRARFLLKQCLDSKINSQSSENDSQ